jgi:hypothetical protein
MATRKKATSAPEEENRTNDQETASTGHYEEWNCKINQTDKGPVAEKLKVVRERVVITDEEASTLNHGRLTGGNSYVHMYFKSEEAEG